MNYTGLFPLTGQAGTMSRHAVQDLVSLPELNSKYLAFGKFIFKG